MDEQVSSGWLLELFEAADRSALATGYPRFTLGPGQRVGSHDDRLMIFTQRLQPISDRIVPDWAEAGDKRPRSDQRPRPSSIPKCTFIDCTAAPLAPLPRLSRRAINNTWVSLPNKNRSTRLLSLQA